MYAVIAVELGTDGEIFVKSSRRKCEDRAAIVVKIYVTMAFQTIVLLNALMSDLDRVDSQHYIDPKIIILFW